MIFLNREREIDENLAKMADMMKQFQNRKKISEERRIKEMEKKQRILADVSIHNTCVIGDPSTRPTVTAVAIIICTWNLFCFVCEIWKSADGRMDREVLTDNMCENNDHFGPWLWVGQVDQ